MTFEIYFDEIINTPIGSIYVALNNAGLIRINFGIPKHQFLTSIENTHKTIPIKSAGKTKQATNQIIDYLLRKRENFDLRVEISNLTEFQQKVLSATRLIPYGQTVSYGQLAKVLKNPKAVRAVGQALGGNPVPIVIPCHRVVASNGKLGGYSGGGGLATKRKLLVLEGILLG